MTAKPSGATQARDALDDAIRANLSGIGPKVRHVIAAREDFDEGGDLVDLMQAAVGLILAIEALQATAAEAEAGIRKAMAVAMSTGATTISTETHTISLREASRKVVITGPVPPEYLKPPAPPAPDLAAIAHALRSDKPLAFASLSNGGAPTIQIRSKL